MHDQHMTHDGPLMVLSFLVALLASYTALDMGSRLRRAMGKARAFWLVGSALVLGGGIWSMHFVAMLAFDAGVPLGYSFDLTALSLVMAIAFVAAGFHLVTRPKPSVARQIAAGIIVGLGVSAMHYTGMHAVIVDGAIHYQPVIVAVSVIIAIVAATAALWLTLNLTRAWQRLAAAVVMAVAVCGMHYTAMAAVSIDVAPVHTVTVDPLARPILAVAVSVGLFLILCLAMVCVFADRRFEFLAEREAEGLRAANKALTDTQQAIRNLLDNADQGFLTVGPELVANDQSSAACEVILGQAPAGKPILELLLPNAQHEAAAMRATLESVFRSTDDFSRDLKLELLPAEFSLDSKKITASYKFLADSGKLMLVLTDVTQARLLSETVECERKRLEMIVLAFTEGETFAGLVNDYREFLAVELSSLIDHIESAGAAAELRRRIHTYKGLLAQFSFHHSPRCLDEIETRLAANPVWTSRAVGKAIRPEHLQAVLQADLDAVSEVMGTEFVLSGRRLFLSQRQLQAMEQTAKVVLATDEGQRASPPLRLLLRTLAGLGLLDAKAALSLHSRGAGPLAMRLEKQLAAVRVTGDDISLSPERYGEFFRSLVHVFRNAVDHGIEDPDQRLRAGKPAEGSISCDVLEQDGVAKITISDDGAGIDRPALEEKLIAMGESRSSVERIQLEDLVFRDGLSSRTTATDISGRGVGLGAVKAELERVNGDVTIETRPGVGTSFCFRLPIVCSGASMSSSDVAPERLAS